MRGPALIAAALCTACRPSVPMRYAAASGEGAVRKCFTDGAACAGIGTGWRIPRAGPTGTVCLVFVKN